MSLLHARRTGLLPAALLFKSKHPHMLVVVQLYCTATVPNVASCNSKYPCQAPLWLLGLMDTDPSTDAINDLVEQYEYECLLSSRNGDDKRVKASLGPKKTLVR